MISTDLKYMPIRTPYQLVKRPPKKRVRVEWAEAEDVALKKVRFHLLISIPRG